jgi:1,4-alpha-glucan branching enzyme
MVVTESSGQKTFRVYLPEASGVELVGSFTDWRSRPIAMAKEDTGWWTATVALNPGDHDFNYLVDGSFWLADYAASGVRRNPYGGWVSQIHVDVAPTEDLAIRIPRRTATRAAA